jgi:hypothetical protein
MPIATCPASLDRPEVQTRPAADVEAERVVGVGRAEQDGQQSGGVVLATKGSKRGLVPVGMPVVLGSDHASHYPAAGSHDE